PGAGAGCASLGHIPPLGAGTFQIASPRAATPTMHQPTAPPPLDTLGHKFSALPNMGILHRSATPVPPTPSPRGPAPLEFNKRACYTPHCAAPVAQFL